MKIKSYHQALKYLDSFIKPVIFAKITPEQARKRDPLDRMRKLLELLGNPQDKFPSILVGGTSGKGSTAYLISHILTTAGYKTGFTLSPHLEKVNERIQINEKPIDDETFTRLVSSIVRTIQLMKKTDVGEPSHFEILIAMAFLYFAKQKVDIAVVEVGLGGRWDATNTLHALIYVLTNVSLDHTAILGDTIEKIAREKAEIVKKFQISSIRQIFDSKVAQTRGAQGKNFKYQINTNQQIPKNPIFITGAKQASVINIVKEKCREAGAELCRLNKEFRFNIVKQGKQSTIFDFTSNEHKNIPFRRLELSLLGDFQVENASLAVQTVLQLRKFKFEVSEGHIRQALRTAFFPGRFEILKFEIILDGAHNPEKMRAFIQSVKKLYQNKKKIFLISFKEDKNIDSMLNYITEEADVIIATEFSSEVYVSNQKAMKAQFIAQEIKKLNKKEIKVIAQANPKKALDILISQYRKVNTLGIITGSLYLVGEMRGYLKRYKRTKTKSFAYT